MTFSLIDQPSFQIQGMNRLVGLLVIAILKARKLINKGCTSYLASLIDINKLKPRLEDILIVWEYPNIFPDELPGQPPEREVVFSIELVL